MLTRPVMTIAVSR